MKVILTEKGKCAGKVSIAKSIMTMYPGEVWTTSVTEVGSIVNAQMNVTRMNKETDRRWMTRTSADEGTIIIVRIK